MAISALNTALQERQTLLYEMYATTDGKMLEAHLISNDKTIAEQLGYLHSKPNLPTSTMNGL